MLTRRALFSSLLGVWAAPAPRAIENPGTCGGGHGCLLAAGLLSASDHELDDKAGHGYFAVGQDTSIVLRPDSVGWLHLKGQRGTTGTLWWKADARGNA